MHQAYIEAHPTDSKLSSAMVAQLAANDGRTADAIAAVNACPGLAHQPATVATLAALLDATADTDAAMTVFESAAAHWAGEAASATVSGARRCCVMCGRQCMLPYLTLVCVTRVPCCGCRARP